eukprot:TRINITY_DN2025_c0_g2_i1.p1 TRINITY_DN2025_c0_g2~~TRINITY_DN2025_c0_g2_i1.p1  ORF type:complete len:606 (-),score=208.44 TRINITY_DN2025_c0_g2_i1:43-1860(-)
MKVIDKLNKFLEEGKPCFSFEYFPPKTLEGVQNLYGRLQRMLLLEPLWIDVTWGAGGSTSELTLDICENSQNFCGLETMMHLTCTNMPREQIDDALSRAKAAGIRNILALRGDPPRGEEWKQVEGGFGYAVDLVKYIKQQYGDWFGVAVAGYPESHTDSTDKEEDIKHLKAKVDAGADLIITQLFYDVDIFIDFVKACRAAGIKCPIVPGIMPIQTYAGFKRMTSLCKTHVPQCIWDQVDPVKDNDEQVKKEGIKIAIQMCKKIMEAGIPYLHFYTLNLEKSVTKILIGLGMINKEQLGRSLPWTQSCGGAGKRLKEEVRPIFWKHRPHSYILRTGSWDDFPNGRWGDHRSPAFGDLSDYHIYNLHVQKGGYTIDPLGEPKSQQEIYDVFARFCTGEVPSPFNEQPLSLETEVIKEKLVKINKQGYLTINSQPAVNGALSSDALFGWGPKDGFVYQKAYIEFFTSPSNLQKLVSAAKNFPYITYHAVNQKGETMTNTKSANAVTWGVFPGKEIIQPTVVDAASFIVWKDEAFGLWRSKWSQKYEQGSASRTALEAMISSFFLVSIVDNNYINGDIFALFAEPTNETTTATTTATTLPVAPAVLHV